MPNRFTLFSIIGGYALVVSGCALWSRPLGLIVAGIGLLAIGILSAKGKK